MLRIRFSRTGKVGQPSFRIVVAEHKAPVKGRYIEMLGHYMPARSPKVIVIKRERVNYWISKGALPTPSVASLFKNHGMENMQRYMPATNHKRKKKGEEAEKVPAPAPTAAAQSSTTAHAEAPAA